MKILITGAAGFIGYHLSKALLEQGKQVIGLDNLNDYYEVSLKEARLEQLKSHQNFEYVFADITKKPDLETQLKPYLGKISHIVHLAAYAGVRYSIKNPYPYAETNLLGFLNILELCKSCKSLEHFVYASSSSVYGADSKIPFSLDSKAANQVSFYGATKRSGELMAYTYSHLFGIPTTGLRFFTVYGPWGRPDMAYFSFTKSIFEEKPITVFNEGKMQRDFTWIEDIVNGILKVINQPPEEDKTGVKYRLYNLGNNKPEWLYHFIEILEDTIGKKAVIEYKSAPLGDVPTTYADISKSAKNLGFTPKKSIDKGLPEFVKWYREYYGV